MGKALNSFSEGDRFGKRQEKQRKEVKNLNHYGNYLKSDEQDDLDIMALFV